MEIIVDVLLNFSWTLFLTQLTTAFFSTSSLYSFSELKLILG